VSAEANGDLISELAMSNHILSSLWQR